MSWSSGRWPVAEVVASAAATPAIKTVGKRRILFSSGPVVLTNANQPCDEKAVSTIVTGRQKPSAAIQTPSIDRRFLHNPR